MIEPCQTWFIFYSGYKSGNMIFEICKHNNNNAKLIEMPTMFFGSMIDRDFDFKEGLSFLKERDYDDLICYFLFFL